MQVTSWLAMGVIGVIGVVTLMRVLLWCVGINRRRYVSAELQEYDQLARGDDHLSSSSYHDDVDDDDKPLYP